MLAEAGAEVIKIERPGGEDMRRFPPMVDGESAAFALLNRGKKVLTLDLKDKADREKLMPLIERADILIEQFRPGVMARLGLGYDDVRAINPRLIYCSISGYGQSGPRADEAGHDINYIGNTGLLDLQPGPLAASGGAADAGRRYRRRQFSGGDQYSAGVARARPKRAGLSSRHRHDRRHVHLRLVCAGAGRGDRQISQAGRIGAGRRLAALSALSDQGRQARRLRRAGAEILGWRSARRSGWRRNSSTTCAIRRRRATRWPN